jgi:2,3,4,5-tetrahydropyridine-2-carboxylate N-succinyltransferase
MSSFTITDPYEIAKYIKDAEKSTPVKAYINGTLSGDLSTVRAYGASPSYVLFGEATDVLKIIETSKDAIKHYDLEYDRRNSAIPLLNVLNVNARIEPGAWIREHVQIGDKAVIMMGAVINIGSSIGEGTMIDMNAVLGARATIGKNCHIGAGAVIAGVLEPPSATPVIIEDGVLVGANCVVLEGVRIGKGAVIAAGAVVTQDIPENAVAAGVPARVLKLKDDTTLDKTKILDDLR